MGPEEDGKFRFLSGFLWCSEWRGRSDQWVARLGLPAPSHKPITMVQTQYNVSWISITLEIWLVAGTGAAPGRPGSITTTGIQCLNKISFHLARFFVLFIQTAMIIVSIKILFDTFLTILIQICLIWLSHEGILKNNPFDLCGFMKIL